MSGGIVGVGAPDPGTSQLINRLANPPNPIEQAGQTINALTGIRDFQAKQAMGQIYSQSIDPTTGQLDIGKFNTLIGANPQAAWAAGPNMQQAGQAVGAQGTGTQENLKATQAQLEGMASQMGPLIARIQQGETISPADAQAALDQAKGLGLITPQGYANAKQQIEQIPEGGNANSIVLGAAAATGHGLDIVKTFGPQVVGVDAGGHYIFAPTGTLTGRPGFGAGGDISKSLTPAENVNINKILTTQVEWPDPADPTGTHILKGTESERLKSLYPGFDPNVLLRTYRGGGGPEAAPPPTTAGSTPGSGNWEVQHNNFAGMRNPNVPAAGGPNTNPSGWQQFDTPEAGVQAISNQLDRYASGATTGKPLNTIRGIVSTWAPASDGNPTPALVARASQIVGVDPDQPLNLSDPTVKAKLVEAMIRNEQGGALPPTAAAAIPKVFSAPAAGGAPVPQPPPAGENRNITAPTPPVGSNLVPGGGVQVSVPNVQLASDFPAGRVISTPTTLPETTKASGQDYTTDLAQYKDLPTRLSMLTQSADILRANPNLGTGTGAGDIQRLASLAQNFGFTLSPQANTNLAAFTELNKDLERYYMSRPGSNRSDLAQAETKMSQPSTEMQRDALQDLIGKTIGLERFNSAPYLSFAKQHGGETTAQNFAPQYQAQAAAYKNSLDQNAFGFDYMTPQQRKDYYDSLPNNDAKQKYLYSLHQASQLYGISIPTSP